MVIRFANDWKAFGLPRETTYVELMQQAFSGSVKPVSLSKPQSTPCASPVESTLK